MIIQVWVLRNEQAASAYTEYSLDLLLPQSFFRVDKFYIIGVRWPVPLVTMLLIHSDLIFLISSYLPTLYCFLSFLITVSLLSALFTAPSALLLVVGCTITGQVLMKLRKQTNTQTK